MSSVPFPVLFFERVKSARPFVRTLLGACFASVPVLTQLLFAADVPLRYAPGLVAVLLAAWCGGRVAGMAAACSVALGINYLLLDPAFHWAASVPAVISSVAFVILAAAIVVGIASVRQRLDAAYSAQRGSEAAAKVQAERVTELETEYRKQMTAIRIASKRAQAHAASKERIERYVERVEVRLAELQAAFAEFPVPVALLAEEDGTPVVRASSSALQRLGRTDDAVAGHALEGGAGVLVSPHGAPFAPSEHPLARAARGETVADEPAGWMTPSGFQSVRLYAKSVAGERMLAIAVLPNVEKTQRTMN